MLTSTSPLAAVAEHDDENYYSSKPNEHVRMAALLLWVRRHVDAPFWQQYVAQLPLLADYTAAGTAWSPDTISQLQWPYLQVRLAPAPRWAAVYCLTAAGYCRTHATMAVGYHPTPRVGWHCVSAVVSFMNFGIVQ
jgi:hypothetical protein